jgi:hypothetical protein
MALVFVDVIEFDGTHIRDFYGDLAKRFARFLEEPGVAGLEQRLRSGVSANSALQMVSRLFFNYFQLEILFGVPEPFGKDSSQIVHEIADMVRHGVTRREGDA